MKILEVTIVKTKSETVLGRADIQFDGFLLKGFKILRDKETGKEYVTPPSYLSPQGWRPLFKTDSVDDWQEISRKVIDRFNSHQLEEFTNETLK